MTILKQSLLALSVVCLFSACKSNNSNTTETSNVSNQITDTVATTANTTDAVGATIELNKTLFVSKVANIENKTFKYLGDKPAIVDFYAPWCGPCKMLSPILEELAKTYQGQIYIYKVNTDEQRELAAAYGISSLPSLLYIPMDGQPTMFTGLKPIETLDEYIHSLLLK